LFANFLNLLADFENSAAYIAGWSKKVESVCNTRLAADVAASYERIGDVLKSDLPGFMLTRRVGQ
jgi:hypothetical protein